MKKPFLQTVIGKILTGPIMKEAIGYIPVAGPIAKQFLEVAKGNGNHEVVSPAGSITGQEAKLKAYGLMLFAAILGGVSVAMGWLTVEQIKQFVKIFGI
jgi:hypothetical protein